MLITCQNCHRTYEVPENLIVKEEETFKCQNCGYMWTTSFSSEETKPFVQNTINVDIPTTQTYAMAEVKSDSVVDDINKYAPPQYNPAPVIPDDFPSPFQPVEADEPTPYVESNVVQEPTPDEPLIEIIQDEPLIQKEEPFTTIIAKEKTKSFVWRIIGWTLLLAVLAGLFLWQGEPLFRKYISATEPFYEKSAVIYKDISDKLMTKQGMEYAHALYRKLDIRTKIVGQGLTFQNILTRVVYERNVPVLLISGQIVNTLEIEKMLPLLHFIIYDENGMELQNQTTVTTKEVLNPGETLSFHGRIVPLDNRAARLDVTFRKE